MTHWRGFSLWKNNPQYIRIDPHYQPLLQKPYAAVRCPPAVADRKPSSLLNTIIIIHNVIYIGNEENLLMWTEWIENQFLYWNGVLYLKTSELLEKAEA